MTESVKIHGRNYITIASRNENFRTDARWEGYTSQSETQECDNEKVVMKVSILNPQGTVVSTGHAEEFRTMGKINQTSCMENCETSAYGRALAFLHPDLSGSEIASADEVSQAIGQQNEREIYERAQEHMTAVRENIESILVIKNALYDSQPTETVKGQYEFADEAALTVAIEAWSELDTEIMKDLWLAPTKGGIFTTQERAAMKSDRWAEVSRAAR